MRLRTHIALLALVLLCSRAQAQKYQPTWESIDSRPTPSWWTDAKFGIFIHWGVYSVPSYALPGEYAEWYWERIGTAPDADGNLSEIHQDARAFHAENYGEDFEYFDFAPAFRAERFDPDEWARILESSGARYVVLVSKHHDGFALWPSKDASKTWGRPWNSVEIGPGRDLVGDLSHAVRQTDLKMGLYYSLYEWFNPLYREDVERFVEEHMHPQFKDLVTRYEPSVIFADGEWDHPSQRWRSTELLAWLFNESAVRDEVVIDDRWGSETRHHHGGYYTTEYGAGLPDSTHPWEETRAIGGSFGFNRAENLEHYSTDREVLLTLIDTVSRGGNFLLNIGPTADGRIPVIMQDRLAYVGNWLEHNGEAIYGTSMHDTPQQWSKGKPPELDTSTNYRARYDVIELTLSPKPGMAVKDILFTRKGDTLFAITPRYPVDPLVIRNLKLTDDAIVNLLGHDGPPREWHARDGNVEIEVPQIRPGQLPFDGAYVFRITGVLN